MQRTEAFQTVQSILSSKREINFAYIFGSFVESEFYSDVDVAVHVDSKQMSISGFEYALRLGAELERAIRIPVDLILMNEAPAHLIHQISKGNLLVNRDDDFRTDFLCASWKRYFDIQPKRLQAYVDMLS